MPRIQRTSAEGPLFTTDEAITNWQVGRIYPTPKRVPSGWSLFRLTAVARLESGHTPSRRVPRYWDGGVPWISLHDSDSLESSEISATAMTISQAGLDNSSARLLPKGTVVFSRTATVGKATIMGREMATSQDFANYVCGDQLDNRYLVYLFRFMEPEWKRLMAGSTHNSIYMPVFQELAILLPPMCEQHRIADALSDLDALIESLEQLLAKKRQIRQGTMQELLTGKKRLDPFRNQWEHIRLGELFDFKNGLNKGKKFFGHGTPIVNYMDVFQNPAIHTSDLLGRVSLSTQELSTFEVLRGDVLFTRTSETADEVGMAAVVLDEPFRTVFSGFLLRARPKNMMLCDEFKAYCFRANYIRRQIIAKASYTTRALTNGKILSGVILHLPGRDEQMAISVALGDIDADIYALEAKIEKARRLKQGMMQELLTGRIRLAQSAAVVIPSPVADIHAAKPPRGHNPQINEAVVIAVLAHRFGSNQFPLGRKRRTKLAYLLHRHSEGAAEGFQKKAAGPYNPAVRYGGAEKIALKNKYVQARKTGKGEGFVAAENIAQAQQYFDKWYGADALSWLEQFHYETNDNLELITTVDMAAEELRRKRCIVDVSGIKQVIRDNPEWVPKLSRGLFSDAHIASAIESCSKIFPQ